MLHYVMIYRQHNTPTFMDTIYVSKNVPSKPFKYFIYVQVYASEFGWVRANPMASEREFHKSLKALFKEIGIPSHLIADRSRSQIQGRSKQMCEDEHCKVIELFPWGSFFYFGVTQNR